MTQEEGLALEAEVKERLLETRAEKMASFRIDDSASEEEAINALAGLTLTCDSHTLDAWRTLITVYDRIPARFKIPMLLTLYTDYNVEYLEFWKRLVESFTLEPIEARQARIERLRRELDGQVDASDMVEIFRGERKGSMTYDTAISWTIDRSNAEWFAKRYPWERGRRRIVSARINIADILRYTNDRQEHEAIIRPMANLIDIATHRVVIPKDYAAKAEAR